jgi:methionyl-tRNA formyltransferase
MQKTSYNIIFAGTPEFAAVALRQLLQSNHRVVAVYTQPDRPAGRGRQLQASAVKEVALAHNLPLYQPQSLRTTDAEVTLRGHAADIMIVAAYGLLLPLNILNIPPLGCLNIHASLLPRWRGAAPIQRAILAGDATTGVSIMQMDVGLDTGDVLFTTTCPITMSDTSELLLESLATLGSSALISTLETLPQLVPRPQDNSLAVYASKITKSEAKLIWTEPAVVLERRIRAFNPWPIAFTQMGEGIIRVWEACVIAKDATSTPGTILKSSAAGLEVATGEGVLVLQKLQLAGGRVLPVAEILCARAVEFGVGKQFE